MIAGNRPDALLAPMSCPTCDVMTPGANPIDRLLPIGSMFAEVPGAAEAGRELAAVTPTVTVAEGGVQDDAVVALAVAVSFTEVTDEAPDATGTCTLNATAFALATEPTVHFSVPSPLPQPPTKADPSPDGCVASATDTPEADPSVAATLTAKEAFCPRWMLAWARSTVTHRSVRAAAVVAVALGLGVAAATATKRSSDAGPRGATECEAVGDGVADPD